MKKIKKIHRLDVLKVCWYRTCRPRTTNVYPLFKAFCLQKYHIQDAQNCITCLRIKASKSLPLCLSPNRIRPKALVCFTYVLCRSPEELFAASPQNPKRRCLCCWSIYRKAIPKNCYSRKTIFFLTFVWSRGIASLLLVYLEK